MHVGEQVAKEDEHHEEHEAGAVAGHFGGLVPDAEKHPAHEEPDDQVCRQAQLGYVLWIRRKPSTESSRLPSLY